MQEGKTCKDMNSVCQILSVERRLATALLTEVALAFDLNYLNSELNFSRSQFSSGHFCFFLPHLGDSW